MLQTENNSASEIVSNAFDFSVDKFPLHGPDNLKTGYYGLFRSDTSEVVGGNSVSAGYHPHTTQDILTLVNAASQGLDITKVDCYFDKGHHVNLAPSDEHRLSIYGTEDNVFPRLIISAGYGGAAFKASLGLWRDACDNLVLMREVSQTTVSIRHSAGLEKRVDELALTFLNLREKWGKVTNVVKAMEAKTVRFADFLRAVYPEKEEATKRSKSIAENRTEAIFKRIIREREFTGRPKMNLAYEVSAWEAFNAVQGYCQHDKSRRGDKDNTRSNLQTGLTAAADPAVAKAEKVAMELVGV